VVMGGHLLHPELTADVSGEARAHSLQEMLILMKLLDARCWKPGPVPSSLCSARFHQKPGPVPSSLCSARFHQKKSILL